MYDECEAGAATEALAGREVTAYQQEKLLVRSQGLSVSRRFGKDLNEWVITINWLHIAFKIVALAYFILILRLTWAILPLPGHWSQLQEKQYVPQSPQDFSHYFGQFDGYSECGIRASNLYVQPIQDDRGFYADSTFCRNRKTLLHALSSGGRVGFDTPYMSKGCAHHWFTPEEMCFILERFDGLVFVGDDVVRTIYSGLVILLRQDLAKGALNTENMSPESRESCRCQNQYAKQDCAKHFVTSSDQLSEAKGRGESPLLCDRISHAYLELQSAKPHVDLTSKFSRIVGKEPSSQRQPVPVIYGMSPSKATISEAQALLTDFLNLADKVKRPTPMLWIGPTAAGHIDVKGRKGNQEIWTFSRKMADFAASQDVEVLNMWNMTVQATSWDGLNFGEEVAITQAMMVLNWLSRLPSR